MTVSLSKQEIKEAKALAKERQGALTNACKSKNGPAILSAYEEWKIKDPKPPVGMYAQTLQGIMADDVIGFTDENEIWNRGEEIFDEFINSGSKPSESLLCIMCRRSIRLEPTEAITKTEKYFNMMEPFGIKPKIRTFLPLFELYSDLGLSDAVEKRYIQLIEMHEGPQNTETVNPGETDDIRLWEQVFAYRLKAWHIGSKTIERRQQIMKELCELIPKQSIFATLNDTLIDIFNNYQETNGECISQWSAAETNVTRDGLCQVSKKILRRIPLSEEELITLLDKVSRLACEGTKPKAKEEWEQWIQSINEIPYYDAIIDGANVGHHNQNWEDGAFNLDQINDTLKELDSRGKKGCVILRRRWIENRTDLTVKKLPRKRALAQIDANTSSNPSQELIKDKIENDIENVRVNIENLQIQDDGVKVI